MSNEKSFLRVLYEEANTNGFLHYQRAAELAKPFLEEAALAPVADQPDGCPSCGGEIAFHYCLAGHRWPVVINPRKRESGELSQDDRIRATNIISYEVSLPTTGAEKALKALLNEFTLTREPYDLGGSKS